MSTTLEQWLEQQHGKIDVDCGCVSTETLMHWMRVAYEAGNSPVTPESWISCSERMPDDGQEVVVQTHSGWRYIAFYESHSGLFYDSPEGDVEYVLVTHWMPLPEPPQEVK